MIPTTTKAHETIGSLGGSQHEMGIDMSSLAHIMSVLTDLYSDPEMAVIREYSTNALDSHVMAGVTRPIEISLPSPLRQTFEVRDFGLGLSVDEVVKVYGMYGASTKRTSNEVNGMLGLGCKSALTYTSMFTVRAVQNGMKAEVAIFRDQNGSGSIEIVDETPTDEPNGVTVVIPTSANSKFHAKAARFYSVWPKGTVLVNEVEPQHVSDAKYSFWIDDKTLMVANKNNDDGAIANIVMGNVAYPLPDEAHREYSNWGSQWRAYYFADMGEVLFTPSRESLNMTPETRKVVQEFSTKLKLWTRNAHNEIKLASSIDEAMQKWMFYSQLDTNYFNGLIYGTKPDEYMLANRLTDPDNNRFKYRRFRPERFGHGNVSVTEISSFYMTDVENYVFLDLGDKPLSRLRKEKVAKIGEDAAYKDTEWIVGPKPKHPFFKNSTSIDLATIDAVVVPKAKRVNAQVKAVPEYDFYESELVAARKTMDDFKGRTIVPVHYTSEVRLEWLKDDADLVFVHVAHNRRPRFEKLYSGVYTLYDVYRSALIKKLPPFTEAEIMFHNMNHEIKWCLNSIRNRQAIDQIDDPRFAAVAAVDNAQLQKKINAWYNVSKSIPARTCVLKSDYPLVNSIFIKSTIEYINLLYAHRKENN